MSIQAVTKDLKSFANPARASHSQGYFKTGKGEYGEGDIFLGLTVPQTRGIAKKYKDLALSDIDKLMGSDFHEFRLCALIILTNQYKICDNEGMQKKIFDFYLKQMKKGRINNWDLVDTSAPTIGNYLTRQKSSMTLIKALAKSKNLWERRIAVMFTFSFLAIGELEPTLKIADQLLRDEHDLIHKATGWALRELGKRDIYLLRAYLAKNVGKMPRTMLRYSIEKMSPSEREKWLKAT